MPEQKLITTEFGYCPKNSNIVGLRRDCQFNHHGNYCAQTSPQNGVLFPAFSWVQKSRA